MINQLIPYFWWNSKTIDINIRELTLEILTIQLYAQKCCLNIYLSNINKYFKKCKLKIVWVGFYTFSNLRISLYTSCSCFCFEKQYLSHIFPTSRLAYLKHFERFDFKISSYLSFWALYFFYSLSRRWFLMLIANVISSARFRSLWIRYLFLFLIINYPPLLIMSFN